MAFEDPYQASTEFGEDYRDVGSGATASQLKPVGQRSHHNLFRAIPCATRHVHEKCVQCPAPLTVPYLAHLS